MALLGEITIDVSKLPKEKFYQGKKGIYYTFTVAVNDETNDFGQNMSVWDKQSQDERGEKTPKSFIGNGKVFWTDGTATVAERKDENEQPSKPQPTSDIEEDDDLPFQINMESFVNKQQYEITTEQLRTIEKNCKVDVTERIDYPPVAISMGTKEFIIRGNKVELPIPIGTLGNFSFIQAPPKSYKTYFASLITSVYLKGKTKFGGNILGHRDGRAVIHFDTEQSKWKRVNSWY